LILIWVRKRTEERARNAIRVCLLPQADVRSAELDNANGRHSGATIPGELDEFLSNCTAREYAEGGLVFSPGETSRSLHVIVSGRVQIDLVGSLIEETALADLGPGQVFGESTFFHPGAHITKALCLEETLIAEFPYAAYETLQKGNSAMAYHLGANAAHILAARLQATDQWIREVLERDEDQHRHELRERFRAAFRPSFETPHGFFGLGFGR